MNVVSVNWAHGKDRMDLTLLYTLQQNTKYIDLNLSLQPTMKVASLQYARGVKQSKHGKKRKKKKQKAKPQPKQKAKKKAKPQPKKIAGK